MNILNIIDAMSWREFLILFSVFMAIVNFVAWVFLIKLQKQNKKVKTAIGSLIQKIGDKGFIDGGVLIALFGVAVISIVSLNETVPKQAVVNKQEIKVDDKIYQCRPIRQQVIKYYDLEEKKTKQLPIKKDCK